MNNNQDITYLMKGIGSLISLVFFLIIGTMIFSQFGEMQNYLILISSLFSLFVLAMVIILSLKMIESFKDLLSDFIDF